jgi:imidazolonepropionase-like amidohydrolase
MTTRTRTAIRADRLFDGTGSRSIAHPLVIVLDLPGTTLLPGLIDTHVHLCFDASFDAVGALAARDDDAVLAAMAEAGAGQLAAGVTTVRDLGDRDYLSLTLRDAATGPLPTIVAAGPPITSAGGHCHFLGGVASGIEGIRAAVREHAERGADVIKVMASGGIMTAGTVTHESQFSPAELRFLVTEAHRHGLPVTAHAHALSAILDAVAAGVDGIEHCAFRTADGVHAPDDVVGAIVAQRIAVGATLGILPVEGAVPPAELIRHMPAMLAAIARLIGERAVVVAGTDAGIAPVKPHGVLPRGLAQLVELGMTAAEALRAGTHVAAQVCGLSDRKGRVAAGYDADLLAVHGDPLTDIADLLRPAAVLLGGRSVTPVAV